jgi:hypothetical protein
MIHAVTVLQDGPLLHLQRDDVLLIDDKTGEVELYRKMDQSYAYILPILLSQGAAMSTLSAAALETIVAGLPVRGRVRSSPEPQADRRRLKLEA